MIRSRNKNNFSFGPSASGPTYKASHWENEIQKLESTLSSMLSQNEANASQGKPPIYSEQAIKQQRDNIAQAKLQLSKAIAREKKEKDLFSQMYAPRTFTPTQAVKVPDPSVSSYEEVKQAVKNNLMAQLSAIFQRSGVGRPGQVSISSKDQKLMQEIRRNLNNFDAYFDRLWKSEFAPAAAYSGGFSQSDYSQPEKSPILMSSKGPALKNSPIRTTTPSPFKRTSPNKPIGSFPP